MNCREACSPPRRGGRQHICRIQGGRICNQQFGIADLEYIQPDFLQPQRSLLLKIALENFLYIFQIGDSKLLIANPPSLDSASMLISLRRGIHSANSFTAASGNTGGHRPPLQLRLQPANPLLPDRQQLPVAPFPFGNVVIRIVQACFSTNDREFLDH